MPFHVGDRIEVFSKADGFQGSYYAAKVISKLPDESYRVQYENLLEDDESRPLVETVSSDEVRPLPPKLIVYGFRLYDTVDAFDNDGWWVGRITGRKGGKYYVYFETCREEIAYPLSRLRFHQEWLNGRWGSEQNMKI